MKYFLLAVLIPLTVLLSAQNPTPKGGANSNNGNVQNGSNGQVAKGGDDKNIEKYPKWKWRRKLKMARRKMNEGSYYIATKYLEDAYKDKPDKVEIMHLLGEANRYLRDYDDAAKYYRLEMVKDSGAYASDRFFLGQMNKSLGKYEDAKQDFQTYLKTKLDKGDASFKAMAKLEIIGCDSALVLIKTPTKIKVEKITAGINTPLQDFAPKQLKDGRVMFTSQKSDTAVDFTTSKADFYTTIFTVDKAGKEYTNRTQLPYPPNDMKANAGNAILSPDEQTMIFTKCGDTLNIGNVVRCKLYRTTKKNALEWNEPEELKSLNSAEGTTTTQPAWGVDKAGNSILYFVSDRKGAKASAKKEAKGSAKWEEIKDMDIFYATINKDGTFGPAINAGPEVNTIGDEVTPFYDLKNKVLYFSSNGHASMGGLDVFKIAGTPGHWSTAVNMGVPINSPADDLYFALDEKGAKGFEVSNRVGTTSPRGSTCCDDIWKVTVQHDVFLKGKYVKRGDPTNTPVEGVDASLYKVVGNNFEFVANAKTTPTPFVMPIQRGATYKMNGNKEGYWPSIDNIQVAEDEERDTIEQTFYIDPIIRIHIKIPNVYFAFDKSNVIDFYKGQIDSVVKILNDHPGYTVEIQGHTDSKGSDDYNQKLSEKRANEVKTYLIKKEKIAENRVVAKWFGKTMPAVPNELPNGEDDPEGRARNRRVEFNIIVDKAEDAPEFEHTGEVVKQVKTGPGFTYGKKAAPTPKKK
jgi:outer membrane protein OmpA-like peptidoglycan-associated protein/tetratricopeptide (TPR) repeat protein